MPALNAEQLRKGSIIAFVYIEQSKLDEAKTNVGLTPF